MLVLQESASWFPVSVRGIYHLLQQDCLSESSFSLLKLIHLTKVSRFWFRVAIGAVGLRLLDKDRIKFH